MKPLNHVAIILDGNGRWAQAQNKSRTYGHKEGMKKIFDTVLYAKQNNIKHITLFCFSTENWNRPEQEVKYLMNFPKNEFSKKNLKKYQDNGIKLCWIGRRNKVPIECKQVIENFENETKNQSDIILNIAFDYGSSEELVNSVKNVLNDYVVNKKVINSLEFKDIYNNLYTANQPPVDLLIRTGGEQRISNFLLLQCAYAEFYFTKTFWPDFNNNHFESAIKEYNNRNRRFGQIKE
ncbi:undecaprenyl diphosphate synthase [Spiroplasma gladiatoris]|uniref:Isoprenyl transferase n=1 Tax=Spiroplasma gladiatoris TaxID=2143 RepID=A0A4P7AIA8_9MOLU|nr:polyprenyl diphosphate synthase [Spiroplasma gladiatoris]QBQ07911.1 undecaprenyl diphosphate synthase [Spiroplasma gladiatoris]